MVPPARLEGKNRPAAAGWGNPASQHNKTIKMTPGKINAPEK